jgi:hypothetical protein
MLLRDLRQTFLFYNWLSSVDAKEREYALRELESIERTKAEEAWLAKPLERMGILINSVADLVNTSKPCPEAVPILWEHLLSNPDEPYNYRESYMRALTVKEAKGSGIEPFVREFIWGATHYTYNYVNGSPTMHGQPHMDVAARAMKYVAVKGDSDKIKTCFPYLDQAIIYDPVKAGIRKDLLIAYKRGGGKLPL